MECENSFSLSSPGISSRLKQNKSGDAQHSVIWSGLPPHLTHNEVMGATQQNKTERAMSL
jgi:hypothetical protein